MDVSQSSGDLLADRRFAWAMALMAEGDFGGAGDLLDQVIERVPAWAPAWAARGETWDRLRDEGAALTAWTQACALDLDGRLGAALHVSRLRAEAPPTMPAAYVRALFDDYAPRFDRHLIEELDYRGPEMLAAALAEAAPGRVFAEVLDLGCGTGLMARALAGLADRIEGVDLSPAMVAQARRTGLYADLTVGSIEETLARRGPSTTDLVVAADVLVYVGDLPPVFTGVFRVLSPDGLFAFTLQRSVEEDASPDVALGPDLRFAHRLRYAEAALTSAGFQLLSIEAASTRIERGLAVPGLIVVAQRTS